MLRIFKKANRELLGTIIQIIIVILILPIIAYVVSLILPKESAQAMWNMVIGLFDDVPLVGSIFSLVDSFRTMAQSSIGYLEFFNNLIQTLGSCIVEAMISGMCVLAMREISVMIKIPGVPAIGIMIGCFLGAFLLKLISAVPMPVKIGIFVVLVVIDVLLIFLTEVGQDKPKKIINLVMIGFQAVISGYALFFSACVLRIVAQGVNGWNDIWIYWIFPAIVLTLMMILDYYVATAKSHSFI